MQDTLFGHPVETIAKNGSTVNWSDVEDGVIYMTSETWERLKRFYTSRFSVEVEIANPKGDGLHGEESKSSS